MNPVIEPVTWMSGELHAAASVTNSINVLTTNFATSLQSGMTSLDVRAGQATSMLAAYASGEPVSSHELVMAMEQAKLSMQFAVEVRNRLVDAYQELTRMQI